MVFGLDDAAFGAIAGGLIQGGSSLLGGMMGAQGAAATNAQQIMLAQQQMAFQAAQQQKVMDWETQMSNTAYQRGMADMKAAGLNPILAANLGGASTPSVGTVPGAMATLQNPGSFMGAGVSSAGAAASTAAGIKATLTQADKDASQTDLNSAQTKTADAVTAVQNATADKTRVDTANSAKTLDLINAQIEANKAAASASNSRAAYDAANTAVAGYTAQSAKAKAELDQMNTDQFKRYGGGPEATAAGFVQRTIGSVYDSVVGGSTPPPASGAFNQPFQGLHNAPYGQNRRQ